MNLIKYLVRFLVVVLFGLIIFIILNYLPWPVSKAANADNGIAVYIADNGVHTTIITPVKIGEFNWESIIELNKINTYSDGNFNYLGFGWGDLDFFMHTPEWKDLNLVIGLKALFIPSKSAIRVSGFRSMTLRANMKRIWLSKEQYGELFKYIYNSFTIDNETGKAVRLGDGYYYSDGFYQSGKYYHLFFTCNNWTALALRRAEVPTAFWPVLSFAVMRYLPEEQKW